MADETTTTEQPAPLPAQVPATPIAEDKPALTLVPDAPPADESPVEAAPIVAPKFAPGDVVYLNSSYVGGCPPMTIMRVKTETAPHVYLLVSQSKDGATMLQVDLPEFAITTAGNL